MNEKKKMLPTNARSAARGFSEAGKPFRDERPSATRLQRGTSNKVLIALFVVEMNI